ncbi:MAG: nickel-binding protein [Haloechinothrix sp.]
MIDRSTLAAGDAMILDGERKDFLVDWVLPAISLTDLRAAQHAVGEAGRRLTAEGEPVRCLQSIYVPSQQRWLCLFTAPSAGAVRRAHEIAQIPVSQIEEVVDLLVGDRLAT